MTRLQALQTFIELGRAKAADSIIHCIALNEAVAAFPDVDANLAAKHGAMAVEQRAMEARQFDLWEAGPAKPEPLADAAAGSEEVAQ